MSLIPLALSPDEFKHWQLYKQTEREILREIERERERTNKQVSEWLKRQAVAKAVTHEYRLVVGAGGDDAIKKNKLRYQTSRRLSKLSKRAGA